MFFITSIPSSGSRPDIGRPLEFHHWITTNLLIMSTSRRPSSSTGADFRLEFRRIENLSAAGDSYQVPPRYFVEDEDGKDLTGEQPFVSLATPGTSRLPTLVIKSGEGSDFETGTIGTTTGTALLDFRAEKGVFGFKPVDWWSHPRLMVKVKAPPGPMTRHDRPLKGHRLASPAVSGSTSLSRGNEVDDAR